MNARNDNTGLAAQMSDKWISDVIGKMKLQGGNLSALSDLLNTNKAKIVKTVTGVDKATGLYTFNDFDKDGNITAPNDKQFLVNTSQQYFGGMQQTLSFKKFTFSCLKI
ncbi:MAG: hypothetical protein EOO47_27815, partial [Flavobacterium sp.]